MSLLDALIYGVRTVQAAGSAMTLRSVINFTGSGVTVTDDSANGRTNVAITAGGGGGTLPVTVLAKVTKTANYTIVASTDYLVICATNTGFSITLPAAPADGVRFEILNNAAGVNFLGGNGHNINASGSVTMSLAAQQAVTATWDAASTTWLVT